MRHPFSHASGATKSNDESRVSEGPIYSDNQFMRLRNDIKTQKELLTLEKSGVWHRSRKSQSDNVSTHGNISNYLSTIDDLLRMGDHQSSIVRDSGGVINDEWWATRIQPHRAFLREARGKITVTSEPDQKVLTRADETCTAACSLILQSASGVGRNSTVDQSLATEFMRIGNSGESFASMVLSLHVVEECAAHTLELSQEDRDHHATILAQVREVNNYIPKAGSLRTDGMLHAPPTTEPTL